MRILLTLLFLALIALTSGVSQAQVDPASELAQSDAEVDQSIAVCARLELLGFHKEGLKRLEEELARNSYSMKLMKAVAKRYLHGVGNSPARAGELYTVALNANRKDAEALLGVTESVAAQATQLKFRHDEEAVKALKVAIQLAKERANELLELTQGKSHRAFVILGKMLQLEAMELPAEERAPKLEEAASSYHSAIKLKEDDFISRTALISVLIETKKFDEANQQLDKANTFAVVQDDAYFGQIVQELRVKVAKAREPLDLPSLADAWSKLAEIVPSELNLLTASLTKRVLNYEDRDLAIRVIKTLEAYQHVQYDLTKSIQLLEHFVPSADPKVSAQRQIVPELAFLSAMSWNEKYALLNGDSEEVERERQAFLAHALRHARAAAPCASSVPWVHEVLGNILMSAGEFDQAKKSFNTMAELKPDDPEFANLAYLCEDMKKGFLTVKDYRLYVAIRSARVTNNQRIGWLEDLVKHAPKFPDASAFLGRLLYQGGRAKDAIAPLETAISLRDDNAAWQGLLGMASLRVGDWEKAHKAFGRMQELDANEHSAVWLELTGRVVKMKTLKGEALSKYHQSASETLSAQDRVLLLQSALSDSPKFAEAQIELSAIYREGNALSQALSFARQGLENATTSTAKASAHTAIASALFALGQYGEAAESYASAADTLEVDDPLRAQMVDFQARCAFFEEDFAKAERLQREAIALANTLGTAYLSRFLPHREALSQIPKIRVFEPGVRTKLLTDLGTNETFKLEGQLESSVEGPGAIADKNSSFIKLDLQILESPKIDGIWRVAMRIEEGPFEEEMIGRRVEMKISPLFGLIEERWNKKLGEGKDHVLKPELIESASFVSNALVELLTPGLGEVVLGAPFAWRNQDLAGALHLKESSEVSYVSSLDEDGVVVHRVGISDYRSPTNPNRVWAPRRRIDTRVKLSFPELRPESVSLGMVTHEVIRDERETPKDVKITRYALKLALNFP